MKTLVATLIALSFAGVRASAHAAEVDADTRNRAAERIDKGRKLYDRGDHAAALAEFEVAFELTRSWKVRIYIGLAEVKLFRYADAMHSLDMFMKEGGAAVPQAQRAQVARVLEEIRSVVAEVRVNVPSPPATIRIDGRVVGTSPLDGPILIESGTHAIAAERPDMLSAQKTLEVVSGRSYTVELSPQPPTPPTGTLDVVTTPPGAQVQLDGQPVGVAPWSGAVTVGEHDVILELDGYAPIQDRIGVGQGQARRMELQLTRIEDPAWYEKWSWWVLLAAGAAAVGGGTYAVIKATGPSHDYEIRFP